MKIAYLAAGAAGMYCGSCLHDNTLAAALLARGEDVLLVPTYTPIRTDETDVSLDRVFMGGINMYLQQYIPLLRRTPRWLDRWLNSPWLLRLATSNAAAVDPSKLGAMTVSMLAGEQGHQQKELDALVDWLVDDVQPDVVHLSNSMMIGLARRIRERCGPPVVCSLSGEDIFLEKLTPPHYERARQLLRERAADVAGFVSLNHYYADFMADYLSIDRTRVHVVPHGLDLNGYATAQRRAVGSTPFRIGYLARICHDKGLHQLVDACADLARALPGLDFEVVAAGYLGAGDRQYLSEIEQSVAKGPLAGRFRYVGELDRAAKIDFLAGLNVFCLPTVYRESKGLPVLEALAAGTPVVLPDHGSFPELVTATGGGVLYPAGNRDALSVALADMLQQPQRANDLGVAGRQAVFQQFQAAEMAERTLEVYQRLRAAASR